MTELLHNLFNPLPNAVMTVVMGILVVYWIFTLVVGAGLDNLDLNVSFDADTPDISPDIDIDGDIDADTDVHIGKEIGFFMNFLQFMNIGKVPFMLILTIFIFLMWIGTLLVTTVLHITLPGTLSLLILLPLFIVCIPLTKLVTAPLSKVFKAIGYDGEKEIDFFGSSGKMLSNIKGDKVGTAEFIIQKNPIKLNVVSLDGEALSYGDHVIIIRESDDRKIYYVSK
ncbi:MAG: DUF1449 family protein [Dysgonomonas sp.]|nr:DUF1449 family protein [Dysgonomonas sp.]